MKGETPRGTLMNFFIWRLTLVNNLVKQTNATGDDSEFGAKLNALAWETAYYLLGVDTTTPA